MKFKWRSSSRKNNGISRNNGTGSFQLEADGVKHQTGGKNNHIPPLLTALTRINRPELNLLLPPKTSSLGRHCRESVLESINGTTKMRLGVSISIHQRIWKTDPLRTWNVPRLRIASEIFETWGI